MKAGALFAGVGGFEHGVEQAGFEIAWRVELDKAARGVLERHWPGVPMFTDVREVGAGNLEPVDLVCGGFPCQDLSVAGRRAGLGGERSGLWWEFHRILSELRPRWCFVENVPGLLSSNGGRDMGAILWSLGQLGYGYAYRVLDARFFGLAQRRRRVLIVGCLGDGRRAAQVLLEPEGLRGDLAARGEAREDIAGTLRSRAGGGCSTELDGHGAYIVNAAESCAKLSHARPADVARCLDSTGGFSANQSGTVVARAVGTSTERQDASVETLVVAGSIHGEQRVAREDGSGRVTLVGTLQHGGKAGVRRLTPVECERLQGFPDGWTEGQSDAARYRQLGNAFPPPMAAWVARRIAAAQESPQEAQA